VTRLLRTALPALLAAGLLLGATPQPRLVPAATSAQVIRSHLAGYLAGSTSALRSSLVDIAGVGSVFQQGDTTAVLPASTQKLFTTLAALKGLGLRTRLTTDARSTAAPVGGVLAGDLYLVAGGDAFLTSAQLDALAAAVRNQGITRIGGHLVLDDYRYDAQRRAPGWKSAFVPEDSGPLSAFALDRNAWRTDSNYLADPGFPNLARFRSMLVKHGISVSTSMVRRKVPAGSTLLARRVSLPVEDMVRLIDKDSLNFGAELMLKELGYRFKGVGSTAAGAAAVQTVLTPLGVTTTTMYDGSGLSANDRQAARGELSVLLGAQKAGLYSPLRAALPIACRDGTLQHRLCGTAAAGRASAKTGTLPGVHALTGWTTTADGHLVRFSFLLTRVSDATKAKAAIDACVAYLSGLRIS
jgi:D-alanyl-D-alanine carboxypeptidase/D-alanyl-D-alanine-endopeptidase (penicillin-binding protein 4)